MKFVSVVLLMLFTLSYSISQNCGVNTVPKDPKILQKSNRVSSTMCVDTDDLGVMGNSYDVPAIITIIRNGASDVSSGWNVSDIESIQNDIIAEFGKHDINFVFQPFKILNNELEYQSGGIPSSQFRTCGKLNIFLRKKSDASFGVYPPHFACVVNYVNPYNPYIRSVLMHEIGHTLNLIHTHGTINYSLTDELVTRYINDPVTGCECNCNVAGDKVCDTVADPQYSYNPNGNCTHDFNTNDMCDVDQQFKDDPNNPLALNFMSYYVNEFVDDCDQNMFTSGQELRMKEALEVFGDELFFEDPTLIETVKIDAGESEVWTSNKTLEGENIINGDLIMSNIKLTMLPGSEIIVNGNLEIHNTHISAPDYYCNTSTNHINWNGIKVNGKLDINWFSVIEDAKIAITCIDNDSQNPVRISNSTFINNVKVAKFRNIHQNNWFRNNTFILEPNCCDFVQTPALFDVHNAGDLCFVDCKIDIQHEYTSAIKANSTNVVYIQENDESYIKMIQTTTFPDFDTYALNITNTTKVKVTGTEINTPTPLRLSAVNTFLCHGNNITNKSPTSTNIERHNHLLGVESFEILNNDFIQTSANPALIIEGESLMNNIVENNMIKSAPEGIITIGNQGSDMGDTPVGVYFGCNEFEQTLHDLSWRNKVSPIHGSLTSPTGNVFAGVFNIFGGADVRVDYYYFQTANQNPNISNNSGPIQKILTLEENTSCDPGSGFLNNPNYDTDHALTSVSNLLNGNPWIDINIIDQSIDSIRSILDGILDGGNTDIIIDFINLESPNNSTNVLNIINSISPNLSSQAAIEILNNSTYYTETEIAEVLINNSHVLSNDYILDIIKCQSFSNVVLNQIKLAEVSSLRIKELKSKIHHYNRAKDMIIRDGLSLEWDNANPNYDNVKYWLNKMNSINNKMWVGIVKYNSQGNSAFEAYKSSLELSNKELQVFEDLEFLLDLRILDNNLISKTAKMRLSNIATKPYSLVSIMARNLCKIHDCTSPATYDYHYPCIDIEFKKGHDDIIIKRENTKNQKFTISPNPNQGIFTITLPKNVKEREYAILTTNGQSIKTGILNSYTTHLDLSHVPKGVYFVKLKNFENGVGIKRILIL